jgi:hypothetical protein
VINPENIVMGPANLYYAVTGSLEPAYTAITSPPSSAVWADVGGIADDTSVLLEIEHSLTDIGVEQLIDRVGARVTKRVIQVTAALNEATLANMQLAMNQLLTISPGNGYTVADLQTGITSVQPQYMALLIDGWAPTAGTTEVACRRRAIVRKCLSSSKVDLEYEKTKQTVYNTTWSVYWVSSSVSPVEIIDQTS